MDVEIAICTWNRARQLAQTIDRLCQITVSNDVSLRLIIVNNNSTDSTAQIIDEFSKRTDICSLFEHRQGHAFARNEAIQAAAGELLIWIDDDVTVGDVWFDEYLAACRNQPDVAFWGGPIRAKFEEHQPNWIAENWDRLSGCYAVRELGDHEFNFSTLQMPYGANFAIRTSLQKQFLFNTKLGRTDISIGGDDELEMFRRLLSANQAGRWLPNAAVDHVIDPSRATAAYVSRYFVGQGAALVRKGEQWSTDVRQLQREVKHELFWFKAKRYFSKSDVWLSHLIRGSLAKGQARGLEVDV